MHRHAGGFVDDDEIGVFVDDVERQRFGLWRCGFWRRESDLVARAGARFVLRMRDRRAVHAELACADQALNAGTR